MIGEYFQDYTAVLIATVAGTAMVLTAFFGSRILAPQARSAKKDIPYECGIEPTGTSWGQMHFRYYLFAILFLIFDVEAVFFYPWGATFRETGPPGLVAIAVFSVPLVVGLVYEWSKGALEW